MQTIALDGTPIWTEQADLIIDDPSALAAVVAVRERVYEFLAEQGRAVAVCPTCAGTVELDLAFYAVALRLPSWRVTDGAFLAVPGLAHPEPPEPPILRPTQERPVAARGIALRPPRPPRAARIDFVLPSARTGLADADDAVAGSLADIEPGREAEAWRTWAPPDRDQPDERMYWAPSRAGFRAVLRLSVAVRSLRDSRSGPIEPTPGSVEHLFLADLQFLDALYTATHELPVETPADGGEPRGTVHCDCGARVPAGPLSTSAVTDSLITRNGGVFDPQGRVAARRSGPTLTGIAYSADAAANLVQADPEQGRRRAGRATPGRPARRLPRSAGSSTDSDRRRWTSSDW